MLPWLALAVAASPCAPELRVDLAPEVLRRKLTAASPGGHDAWLASLHLGAVTAETWEAPKLVRAELVPAQLTGAKTPDLLVQLVFSTRFTEAWATANRGALSRDVWLYRLQVLRPEGTHWCAVGDALSADVPVESLNAGPADGMKDTALPWTFTLVHFTRAERHTIEVKKPFDNLSRATSSGARVEWWDLVGGKWVQVLELTSASTRCPMCEHPWSRTWFELRGPPPVSVVQFTRACDEPNAGTCTLDEQAFAPRWQPVTP